MKAWQNSILSKEALCSIFRVQQKQHWTNCHRGAMKNTAIFLTSGTFWINIKVMNVDTTGSQRELRVSLWFFRRRSAALESSGIPAVSNNLRSQTPDRLSSCSDNRRVRVSERHATTNTPEQERPEGNWSAHFFSSGVFCVGLAARRS